ncbi:hypothetical protein WJX73_009615 [Symbiochloris irregularis]|uniref:Uncharacterized protein n=1 Tax=Symbiochloris irregularis TaxID=706552 RepID=A0AAW1NZA8_9CHLO
MSAKQKRAVPGTAWPELSKSDLRTLLRDIGVKTSEFEQAKTKAIRELFAKTLAKAHSLPLLADCLGTLDPESMTKCDPEDLRAGFSFAGPDTGKKTAYLETLRAQELMEAEPDNSFLHYRMRLHILGEEYWEGAISAALMRHEESELAILLNIKDMRIGPDGTPLLMVSFGPCQHGRVVSGIHESQSVLSRPFAIPSQKQAGGAASQRGSPVKCCKADAGLQAALQAGVGH